MFAELRKLMKRLLLPALMMFLILFTALLFSPVFTTQAFASDDPPEDFDADGDIIQPEDLVMDDDLVMGEDIVMDETELALWCEDHDGIGGTVYLGQDITITEIISGGYRGGHIIINTGKFGIIYDGGCISLYDWEITGEGVDRPVLTVIETGSNWGMGNWNNDLAFKFITATGRDGIGGTALHVTQGNGAVFSTIMVDYDNGLIRSYGEGAVGLLVDEPMDLCCFRVETYGDNSVAVLAPYGAALYYCRLYAEGEGAAVVSGPDIILDVCTVSPFPADAVFIERTLSEVSGKRFYLPVRLFDEWIFPESYYTFFMPGSDGSELKQVFMIDWDWDAINGIDTGVIGSYFIQGCLLPLFDGFGLTDGFTLTIEVRDPAIPCIEAVYFSDWDGNVATLSLWDEYDPSIGGFILWRSDDGGETWYDFTDSPELGWPEWNRSAIEFRYDQITHPIMFCLEVPGIGESNVVTLYEKDGMPFGETGGDRTGIDRGGGGDNPFGNPPDGNEDGDGENDNGENDDGDSSKDNNDGDNGGGNEDKGKDSDEHNNSNAGNQNDHSSLLFTDSNSSLDLDMLLYDPNTSSDDSDGILETASLINLKSDASDNQNTGIDITAPGDFFFSQIGSGDQTNKTDSNVSDISNRPLPVDTGVSTSTTIPANNVQPKGSVSTDQQTEHRGFTDSPLRTATDEFLPSLPTLPAASPSVELPFTPSGSYNPALVITGAAVILALGGFAGVLIRRKR